MGNLKYLHKNKITMPTQIENHTDLSLDQLRAVLNVFEMLELEVVDYTGKHINATQYVELITDIYQTIQKSTV